MYLNNDTKRFLDILKGADLTQTPEDQTRATGHTVELLMTLSSDAFREQHTDIHSTLNDSHCTLQLAKPSNIRVTITWRSYRHIRIAAIHDDIGLLLLPNHLPEGTNYTVDKRYETTVAFIGEQEL